MRKTPRNKDQLWSSKWWFLNLRWVPPTPPTPGLFKQNYNIGYSSNNHIIFSYWYAVMTIFLKCILNSFVFGHCLISMLKPFHNFTPHTDIQIYIYISILFDQLGVNMICCIFCLKLKIKLKSLSHQNKVFNIRMQGLRRSHTYVFRNVNLGEHKL